MQWSEVQSHRMWEQFPRAMSTRTSRRRDGLQGQCVLMTRMDAPRDRLRRNANSAVVGEAVHPAHATGSRSIPIVYTVDEATTPSEVFTAPRQAGHDDRHAGKSSIRL